MSDDHDDPPRQTNPALVAGVIVLALAGGCSKKATTTADAPREPVRPSSGTKVAGTAPAPTHADLHALVEDWIRSEYGDFRNVKWGPSIYPDELKKIKADAGLERPEWRDREHVKEILIMDAMIGVEFEPLIGPMKGKIQSGIVRLSGKRVFPIVGTKDRQFDVLRRWKKEFYRELNLIPPKE